MTLTLAAQGLLSWHIPTLCHTQQQQTHPWPQGTWIHADLSAHTCACVPYFLWYVGDHFKQRCQCKWRHTANTRDCTANSRNVPTHSRGSQQLSETQNTLNGPWKVFVKPDCLHLLPAKLNLLQRQILSQRKGQKPKPA